MKEVERVSSLSGEDFEHDYLVPGHPVVIENYFQTLPSSKWNLQYLLENVPDNEVNVRGQTDSQAYKLGKSYTLRKTTLSEYVRDLQDGNYKGRSSYMAVQNISKVFPQLVDECVMPKYIGKPHNGPFLWIAHKGHYEFCHFDPDEGMLMMIEGEKEIKMFCSSDLLKLYPNALGSKGKTIQSQVDCNEPDYSRFPDFKDTICYHCNLHAGEMLYIPAFWWHQVTSVTDVVSANIFFGDAGENTYITRHIKGESWPAFRWWILNIIEQNRCHSSFQRSLSRLSLCVENLLLKQFHEKATVEQLDFIVKIIIEYLGIEKLPSFENGGKNPPPIKIRGLRWR